MPSSRSDNRDHNSSASIGFEAKLWLAADKLRSNMDPAEYKHVVLGLIFLKYISDSFEEHYAKLIESKGEYAGANPDEYRAENIFWVPPAARWTYLQNSAKQPTIGKIIDDAMVAIERDNPRLKGILPKDYAPPALDKNRLGELIDLIGMGDKASRSKRCFRSRLRIFPQPVRQRGRQERRPVLYSAKRRASPRRDARALQRPRLRPLLRFRRHVRAIGKIRRSPRRPALYGAGTLSGGSLVSLE